MGLRCIDCESTDFRMETLFPITKYCLVGYGLSKSIIEEIKNKNYNAYICLDCGTNYLEVSGKWYRFYNGWKRIRNIKEWRIA